MTQKKIAIIGGGLAGSECAFVLANAGVNVTIFEMKPEKYSPAHTLNLCAELVCSNSFRSDAPDSAVGLLKEEMRTLDSLCMKVADITKVPAGKSLAVDRLLFAEEVTKRLTEHQNITLVHQEVTDINPATNSLLAPFDAVVVAAGPLASEQLAASLATHTSEEHLYFYDAIAPVIDANSVNMDIAFWGGRYQPEDTDYLNCPMTKDEYFALHEALITGKKAPVHDFEKEIHFEGCMPIEALAERGPMTLAFGCMKPVGFVDPRTGQRPFALLQLRAENTNKSMFNLVGCQTKLTFGEQERIFRMVPGLESADFIRFGSMHRNTFVNAPNVLTPTLALKSLPSVYLAGQITGVEGYVESAACGLWLGFLLKAQFAGHSLPTPPVYTALGALLMHLQTPAKKFQPSNVQFGLMPELGVKAKKMDRKGLYAQRATAAFAEWLQANQQQLQR